MTSTSVDAAPSGEQPPIENVEDDQDYGRAGIPLDPGEIRAAPRAWNPSREKTATGFDTIEFAISEIAAGRAVVVVDDEDRENEGDLIFAAELATPELVAFTVRYSSGVICVALTGPDCDRLDLPPMSRVNQDRKGTAFTVSVDAKEGITTGISAAERTRTIRLLADPSTTPDDLTRPGHVFPLRAREGGVLVRPGHTEAGTDLTEVTLALTALDVESASPLASLLFAWLLGVTFFLGLALVYVPAIFGLTQGWDGWPASAFAFVSAEATPPGQYGVLQLDMDTPGPRRLAHSSLYDDPRVIDVVARTVSRPRRSPENRTQ